MPPNTVNVARPTKWGNPYQDLGSSPDARARAIKHYESWLNTEGTTGNVLKQLAPEELRGKNLACWCKIGELCHADVLLRIANEDAK